MKTLFLLLLVSLIGFAQLPKEGQQAIPLDQVNCRINVWPVWEVKGSRCRRIDEAMVGIKSFDPLIIQCGRVTTYCNQKTEKTQKPKLDQE